ncbi:MAG: helix-turn-helix domain-containing protein [Cellvibrio sp.]|uniref:MarR family transcriptional regulator n=1 Tax=Cellvibrio sp. TaxID=1965322 RepID=UPI00271AE1E0|nr:helix-turn-helix domain-containing protein [Cellvibrio sp.]
MKSQDILLLLKLISMEKSGAPEADYSVRQLEAFTGISKSELSASLNRCIRVGLVAREHQTGLPKVNRKALLGFLLNGIRYVFPVRPAELVRGIPTSFAAPVMEGKVMSAGDTINVWPDATGKTKGQAIAPLFKSAPAAAKADPKLYELLALVDAVRIGNVREAQLAAQLLEKEFIYESI